MAREVEGNTPFDVNLDAVLRAEEGLRDVIQPTPLIPSPALSEMAGAEVLLKLENLLFPVGSFKLRGVFTKVSALTPEERNRGMVTASAGNHAQAVAYCAQRFGIEATVFMPEKAPRVKVENTRRYGAEVVLKGRDYDEAEGHACAYAEAHGGTFVHPTDDPLIVAGHGTAALEMLRAQPDIDLLVVPAGGGGLVTGCGVAAKGINPNVEVVAVQPEVSAPFFHAYEAGRYLHTPVENSLADALVGEITCEALYHCFRGVVDQVKTVSEEAIAEGIYWMLAHHRLVVEGGAAVGIAAILGGKIDTAGRKVAVVVTGSGIDFEKLMAIVDRFRGRGAHG